MSFVVKILLALGEFFIALGRNIGKEEAYAQSKAVHDERVAQANAARADADAISGVHDPYDRDTAGRN